MANRQMFQPIRLSGVPLRNRVVMPPMLTNMGVVGKQSVCWYRERARGGVGLVIVEGTGLARFGDPAFVKGLETLVSAVKGEGAAIAIQLFLPPQVNGEPVAVTAGEKERQPTEAEIRRFVAEFAHVGRICRDVGFDGVEPHGAHGFFLNQFFSTKTNRRTDAYGGSLQGRMRLGLEIVRAVRDAVGEEFLILYRHTPAEEASGGYLLEDSLTFAAELVSAGVNVMDISPSTSKSGAHCDWAAAIRAVVDVPVLAVGGMQDADAADRALRDGKCDLVAVGRQLIADAHWTAKVRDGREDEVIHCQKCNEGCYGALRRKETVHCVNNPDSGREYLRSET